MSYDYQTHFAESAQAYVFKHKDEPDWVNKMIRYYTSAAHPYRLHEYTKLVVNVLLAVKALEGK